MLHNLSRDREAIVTEVTSRIVEEVSEEESDRLLEVINDTLYRERERLRKYSHLYTNPEKDKVFYKRLSKGLGNLSDKNLVKVLGDLVHNYIDEIVGNFDRLMYGIATHTIPGGLTFMLNTMSPFRIFKNFPAIPSIDRTLLVGGCLEKLRRLKEKGGVLVHVPEHQSNLDSPVLGYSIYKAALPPVMYGAGYNLFQMPLFSFFMDRLGAYKVDRLKTSSLYKRILKEYATVTLEFGYDHLFFPGGTRSRSGGIENRLKKGLLGTVLKAYVSCRKQNKDKRFYIVPVTASYHLTLEASTLIEDYLKEKGKSRYIIIDDESSKPAVIINFMNRLISLEGRIYVHFCEPLDPFGNNVDDDGNSIDARGRIVDIDGYITRGGRIVHDGQRDTVYTNELEKRIVKSYFDNTILLVTHAAAHVMLRLLRKKFQAGDLYKFLREESYTCSVPSDEMEAGLGSVLDQLRRMEQEGKVKLEPALKQGSAFDVLMSALRYFGVYHRDPVIQRKGNRLFTRDPNLLYYYHNRLTGYDLEVAS